MRCDEHDAFLRSCRRCRQHRMWNARRCAAQRERRRSKLMPDRIHGTVGGYTYRAQSCRLASAHLLHRQPQFQQEARA